MAESGQLSSLILWGPAGTGKTTLARILATSAGFEVRSVSAVTSGVKDLREILLEAEQLLAEHDRRTVLFIDEVHRFNKSQQDLLLPATENGQIVLIGATTENPYFEVNAALMSRTTLWRVLPHSAQSLRKLIDRGLRARNATASKEAIDALIAGANGDGRSALTTLDVAIALANAAPTESEIEVTAQNVAAARDGRIYHQSDDTHYDQVSAFIKSVRGSDADAALFWLVTLLDAGESPRFLARRLVILASEDVGLADPLGLVLAESAARAVEFVGLPEARLNLAHATIALSLMPKSNSVTMALGRVTSALQHGASTDVPPSLRDAHYRAASELGHGEGYLYPHDFLDAWVAQEYLDPSLRETVFFEPTSHGREGPLVEQWRHRRGVDTQENQGPSVD